MVHVRLNEKEKNPNPHINFITPLKMADTQAEEQAKQLLRALAAQVRPIMKAEGFVINSFEEYEHNKVFAGRNWNNGETVELVLRGAHGGFLPTSWLLSTLCHELAHIKHMNHGPAFQALWAKLRADVRRLQSEGYYGDGFWSSGTRVADFARMGGQGLDSDDLPEFMCGGAQSRARPASRKRRRSQPAGPSNRTGAQTAKKRKPGTRVRAKGAFSGTGRALNDDIEDEELKKTGTGFRKQARSKRAREERALAAERRLLALQGHSDTSHAAKEASGDEDENEEDSDYEAAPETDQERRRAMLESTEKSDLEDLKTWQRDYSSDFIFPPVASGSGFVYGPSSSSTQSLYRARTKDKGGGVSDVIELSSDEEDSAQPTCDVQLLPKGGTAASSATPTVGKGPGKEDTLVIRHSDKNPAVIGTRSSGSAVRSFAKQRKLAYGGSVQQVFGTRTKETHEIASSDDNRLGSASSKASYTSSNLLANVSRRTSTHTEPPSFHSTTSVLTSSAQPKWPCHVCTLLNEPGHLACSACATPRGESIWLGNTE
ncbi:WLM-domain-containing protein [Dichomitus squalens LYAD-421 SS1]|uniref:WLM-domain-containing protein n=1 Tax=Dichomitus squalens TaxID=114155 RepID=A0A4Q9PUA4_9APHY|nr:WLM-domain-containing protein [Dichomitus squalens LYAD-421 SS1]EJF64929.1 WLM-domain-containing protein [Dichomitus squalens LYAD-421 SS1]TBU58029.1 WLM-domain-containing protein [Dichomitus squalens]